MNREDLSFEEDVYDPEASLGNSQERLSFLSEEDTPYTAHPQVDEFGSSLASDVHPSPQKPSVSKPIKSELRIVHCSSVSIPSHSSTGLNLKVQNLLAHLEIKEAKIESLERLQTVSRPSQVHSDLEGEKLKVERYELQLEEMTKQILTLETEVTELRNALSSQQSELAVEQHSKTEELEYFRSELGKKEELIKSLQRDKQKSNAPDVEETRIRSVTEVKRLRQALDEKNKKLASLQRLIPMNAVKSSDLFSFLSSAQAQLWTNICTSISHLIDSSSSRSSEGMVRHLDVLLELLESKDLASSLMADSLAELCMKLSKALNQVRVPWDQTLEMLRDAQRLCKEEVDRLGRPEQPSPKSEVQEEYLSDFSDEDFSVEIAEEDLASKAVPHLQSALPKYQFSHSGLIAPKTLFQLLSLRVLDADEPSLEAFIRRLPVQNGFLTFETFVKDVKTRSTQWWLKSIAAASFDLQHQTKEGTFLQVPVWTEWVNERLLAKVQRFMAAERIAESELIERLFPAGELTKKDLRHSVRRLGISLTREDCHALFRLLDNGHGYVTLDAFRKFLTASSSATEPTNPPTEELAAISERDAHFRLLQAEQRIAELERNRAVKTLPPNLTKEHTLSVQVTTLERDCEQLSAQLAEERRQIQSLQSENEDLRIRLSVPNRYESDLRKTAAVLETTENDYKRQFEDISGQHDRLISDLKRKHEEEKTSLMRLVKNKNRELESLTQELDRLLSDLDALKRSADIGLI